MELADHHAHYVFKGDESRACVASQHIPLHHPPLTFAASCIDFSLHSPISLLPQLMGPGFLFMMKHPIAGAPRIPRSTPRTLAQSRAAIDHHTPAHSIARKRAQHAPQRHAQRNSHHEFSPHRIFTAPHQFIYSTHPLRRSLWPASYRARPTNRHPARALTRRRQVQTRATARILQTVQ